MLILYSFVLTLVLVVGAPWWLFRMATSGKYREGLSERLGFVPERMRQSASGKRVVWVHAVSVGEVLAASRLIEELGPRLDARGAGWRVVVSTTTRTGQKLARERFGAERVFYFPLDFGFAVRAWLRMLRPAMLVLMETEFWPRVLVEFARAGIPVAVVNARISDRSWPRYRRLRFLWRQLLRRLTVVLAQTERDSERLRAIGAANVRVGGNLKFDVRALDATPVVDRLREHLAPGAKVLVCGSTLAGEEELLLGVLPDDVVTVLAPRHPERFGTVAELLERSGRGVSGRPWVRRSAWMEAPAAIAAGTVFLLDSIGELASVYSLADAAFIGGSLVPAGGHNPLEAAQFGVPILMGPHYENFRGIVKTLQSHDAMQIVQSGQLGNALQDALSGSAAAREMGAHAREVFEREAGATVRTLAELLAVVGTQA